MEGVGAVLEPVPPEEAVYQSSEVPVALLERLLALAFRQYAEGLLTDGWLVAFTVATTEVRGKLWQP